MFSNPKFDEIYEKMGFALVTDGDTLNFNEKPLFLPFFYRFSRLRRRAGPTQSCDLGKPIFSYREYDNIQEKRKIA